MNFEVLVKVFISLIIFIFFFTLGLFFKKFGYKYFLKWAKATKWRADDILVPLLRNHLFLWSILLGLHFSLNTHLSPNAMAGTDRFLIILFLASLTLLFSKFVSASIKLYSETAKTTLALSELIQGIARFVVFVLGALMILNTLGISITPILTTLGIGGLAVALALQDTLSNFFAGFHIVIAKQIRIGDCIRLDNGAEGYVMDINWRITKLRMPDNNIIFVPNSKLSQSIIVNYHLPDKEIILPVGLSVSYGSDLEEVEQATLEVARSVIKDTEGAVSNFEPALTYNAFGESGINLTVVMRVKEFGSQAIIKHEFIKRLYKKYKEKGITIALPVRAINLTQEGADKYFNKKTLS